MIEPQGWSLPASISRANLKRGSAAMDAITWSGDMSFGDYLSERRGDLTQRELARRIGVTQGAISQYEKGLVTPPPSRVAAIARELKAPLDEMLAAAGYYDLPEEPSRPRSTRGPGQVRAGLHARELRLAEEAESAPMRVAPTSQHLRELLDSPATTVVGDSKDLRQLLMSTVANTEGPTVA